MLLEQTLPLLAIGSILVPFAAALLIVVSPQRMAKGLCITAAAISTVLSVGAWLVLAGSGQESVAVQLIALGDAEVMGFVFER